MSIDPCLFTMGILGLQRSIERSAAHTTHTTHTTHITEKIDEEKLAHAIVREQRRQEQNTEEQARRVEEDLKNDTEHQFTLYAIRHGRDTAVYEKTRSLFRLLKKEKPSLEAFSPSLSRLQIYPPTTESGEYYIKIGKSEICVEAYVFQLYLGFFASHCAGNRKFWRENMSGNIYFVIKNEFAEELGWK